MSNVGQNIKKARIRAGLSQYRLAKISGIAQATISAIEADDQTRSPAVDTIEKLAASLNCSVTELLSGTAEPSVLSSRDHRLLTVTHQLNDDGFSRVLSYAEDLVSSGNYEKAKTPAAG